MVVMGAKGDNTDKHKQSNIKINKCFLLSGSAYKKHIPYQWIQFFLVIAIYSPIVISIYRPKLIQ